MTTRPGRLVVVTGTGTGVGKTWVAARLLGTARAAGLSVAARKPAQSFEPGDPTDADVLGLAAGEPATAVCPPHRWYEVAVAPFMAAERLGRPAFALADLLVETTWDAGVGLGLVEGAGGVRSPITSDGADTVDLVDALHADRVVVVADAGLGTLNAVRLTLEALGEHPAVVVLNRFDGDDALHVANHRWLADRCAAPVLAGHDGLLAAVMD